MQVRLSARAASIAQAALALAAPWSLDVQLSVRLLLRRGGPLLFTAGCTDFGAHQIYRVAND